MGPQAKAFRAKIERPSGPRCPDEALYLWGYFSEITLGLAITGMATPVVSWEALRAWCGLRRVVLAPWESMALVRLGQKRAEVVFEKQEAERRIREKAT